MASYVKYATSGLEFKVSAEMNRRGIIASVPRFNFIRREGRGKYRKTVLDKKAALPNVILAEIEPQDLFKLQDIKHLSATYMLLPEASRRDVSRFLTELDGHNEAVQRLYARSGALTPEFGEGALVKLVAGPMADLAGTFRRVVQRGEEIACQVEVSMMGRTALVDVPPDELKAAE